MTSELRLTIIPRPGETRILMTDGLDEILVARLGPATAARHRWAAPMLLEALGIWQGCPLRVVLSAESEDCWSSLGLTDGLGLGVSAMHYVVDVVDPRTERRGRRLRGVGDFRDARRQLQLVYSR